MLTCNAEAQTSTRLAHGFGHGYAAQKVCNIAEVAERVGYSSASTFSVAFTRHVGLPLTLWARADRSSHSAVRVA